MLVLELVCFSLKFMPSGTFLASQLFYRASFTLNKSTRIFALEFVRPHAPVLPNMYHFMSQRGRSAG
jgi:hypothetical protein